MGYTECPSKGRYIYGALSIFYIFSVLNKNTEDIVVAFFFLAFVTILLIIDQYTKEKYNKILEKIDILEFVDKRPFKESSLTVRRKYLGRMLRKVNSKIVSELKTNHRFKSTSQLVGFHDDIIANFVNI